MHPLFDERRYLIPFRSALLPQIFTDVLIIGAGVAGMRAALAAAEGGNAEVIITTKAENTQQSNTYWAQGGIATVVDGDDSFESHIEDTLNAGAGLCDRPVVKAVVEGGPPRIKELIDWGMRFDRAGNKPDGKISLGREGGHERSRILHADGDATGRELAITLERVVRTKPNIRLFTNCFVLDLITIETAGGSGGAAGTVGAANGTSGGGGGGGRCIGAITHHPKYGLQVIWAHSTILASGGSGQVWRESTNPNVATGDGIAMAYRAGAVMADMAFMQFHPTTLYVAGAARSLITEAVRGEGAHLIDRHGRRFMPDYHPMAELAPRDIVSRAILAQMAKTNHTHVYLDARHIGSQRFAARFPGIFELLKRFDIDPGQHPIPIHPSAHYMIGGALTDLQGRTNITGLYACGEAACSGLHGANRLASNSLLEGLVYGAITGKACREMFEAGNGTNGGATGAGSNTSAGSAATPGAPGIPGAARGSLKVVSDIRPSDRAEMDLSDVRSSLRSAMWRQVGIERAGDQLKDVLEMFDFWASYTLDKIFDDRAGWEVQNMLLVGALITRAALWRDESRGTHYRLDRPNQREEFRIHDAWQRGQTEPQRVAVREG